ncbi:MAG TPA: PQQ-binding-like beta-propeller repeat protein [Candidatus Sulfotelmatobacter sp.]|nr:PQQ-binding-like beta-propeller repeat protein [Candidatus Sulfotelmatobacter sp.]
MRSRNAIAALLLLGISVSLFVFNRRTGSSHALLPFVPSPVWTADIGRVTIPLALAPDGTVYALTDAGDLKAIDRRGIIRWSRSARASGRIHVAPAVGTDGAIYLLEYSKLVVFNPDGTFRTEQVMNTAGLADGIALTDKRLYTECARGGACGWLLGVDSDAVWTLNEGPFLAAPIIEPDGTTFWGGNRLMAAAEPNPILRWTYPGGAAARQEERHEPLAMQGDETVHIQGLAAGADGTIYVSGDSGIMAVGPAGQEKWEITVPTGPRREPVVASDGTIYFSSEDHHLHALHPDGRKAWTVATKSAIGQPLLGSGGTILFTDAKYLRAVDSLGHDRWSIALDEDVWGSPTLGKDGTLYVATIKGTLYAIPVGENLMQSSWPKFQANARNSGQAGTP